MAHGGYGKRRVNPAGRRSKGLGVEKKPKPKPKSVSLKNQIRSIERMLRKDLPSEIQEKKLKELEQLKKQQEIHSRLAVERKIFLRDRKIKFFERRKVERRIRRLEKLQRASSGQAQDAEIAEQLSKLKEDLEYVRFFPKTEKYVSLFTGGDDSDIVDRRNKLRKQIKANLVAAAASGKDLEETGSEDDGLMDLSEDDFFLGSSSDEADADDEWTDKSTREQASSASGKAASGMSSDERNQISARALMPPPRPATITASSSSRSQSRFGPSSSKNKSTLRAEMSTSSNTSNGRSGSAFKSRGSSKSKSGHSSNLSSNSDAHKPRRKRRPKKKKQQA
ncbi:rRNA-processing protein EFG1 isoform X2 [Corylus avellana]|uniref:rRNA-processing protein EFG1 isoform X2 n=1 Tax=Corylus avellana TaxID=13451 RepID=UPI00286CF1BF|nr:rRNA-processing protein EFG1 isoform X2 [Corylus avellana]